MNRQYTVTKYGRRTYVTVENGYKDKIRKRKYRASGKLSVINNRLFRVSFIAFLVIFICIAGLLNITAEGSDKPVSCQYKSVQIKEGDTLWSIATEFNDEGLSNSSTKEYIEDIISINNLGRDDNITAGNYLIIPIYVLLN